VSSERLEERAIQRTPPVRASQQATVRDLLAETIV
jgi:hypothetical protein